MRYATLKEMQDHLEFGVTGDVRVIGDVTFERLEGRDYDHEPIFGWAALHLDEKNEMVDWDRVPPQEAVEMKLVKKSQIRGAF